MHKNAGFTLIELVIVVIVLSLLAIVAAPKLINMSNDARLSSLETMMGAMKSGAKMIHTKAVIDNKTFGSDSLTLDSANVSLHSGYPVGNWMQGIRYIVNLDTVYFSNRNAKCQSDWCGMGNQRSIPSGVSTPAPGRIGKVFPRGYSWNDECGVYYLNPENGEAPTIGLETSDC